MLPGDSDIECTCEKSPLNQCLKQLLAPAGFYFTASFPSSQLFRTRASAVYNENQLVAILEDLLWRIVDVCWQR